MRRQKAHKLLVTLLADGPVEFSIIKKKARFNLISLTTLRRAAREMGVSITLSGFADEKKSLWTLDVNNHKKRQRLLARVIDRVTHELTTAAAARPNDEQAAYRQLIRHIERLNPQD